VIENVRFDKNRKQKNKKTFDKRSQTNYNEVERKQMINFGRKRKCSMIKLIYKRSWRENMFAKERKREILRILDEQGKVKTLELAEALNVSEPTIRRDIADLDKQGALIRTHGGALPVDEQIGEPTFSEKVDRFAQEKIQIGKTAASFISDGNTIVLDGGTTTLQVARYISAKDVTVLTNALDIAEELENKEGVNVILTGGNIRWNTRALVGPVAESTLKSFRVDMAFIGTNAISIDDGITTPNLVEASVKKTMIEISKRAFVVADHTKFDKSEFCQVAGFSELSGIITDAGMPQNLISKYENSDLEIILKEGDFVDLNSHPESGSR